MRSLALLALCGCSTVVTARLAPGTVEVGPGVRPIAAIQATVTTAYVLFIPIPGGIDLDRLVNRMLIVTAKTMGADKVAGLSFHVECPGFCLSRILGVVEGHATGIAVQIDAPPPDPHADDGPEARPR